VLRDAGAPGEPLPWCEHRFTHLSATYVPHLFEVAGMEGVPSHPPPHDLTWIDLTDPTGVALPVAQRRILDSARDHLGSTVA
jgi:hypothetical protein